MTNALAIGCGQSFQHKMLVDSKQIGIYNAQLWQTPNFDTVLFSCKLGYSDGTRGLANIPAAIRPAAWGAAIFEYETVNGRLV